MNSHVHIMRKVSGLVDSKADTGFEFESSKFILQAASQHRGQARTVQGQAAGPKPKNNHKAGERERNDAARYDHLARSRDTAGYK